SMPYSQLRDEELAGSAGTDSALNAAVAYSCKHIDRRKRHEFMYSNPDPLDKIRVIQEGTVPNNEPIEIDPVRYKSFWMWWLQQAIPEAWKMAAQK
ncbi:MAG: hypothetical protein AAF125_05800, partial [Chloroflexota bacterium]